MHEAFETRDKIQGMETEWRHTNGSFEKVLRVYVMYPLTEALAHEVVTYVGDLISQGHIDDIGEIILVGPNVSGHR